MKLASKIPPPMLGRKDLPSIRGHRKYYFPIKNMKVGQSFNTKILYDYGKTISIKNHCRNEARKLGINMRFSVGKWKQYIRVWRVK